MSNTDERQGWGLAGTLKRGAATAASLVVAASSAFIAAPAANAYVPVNVGAATPPGNSFDPVITTDIKAYSKDGQELAKESSANPGDKIYYEGKVQVKNLANAADEGSTASFTICQSANAPFVSSPLSTAIFTENPNLLTAKEVDNNCTQFDVAMDSAPKEGDVNFPFHIDAQIKSDVERRYPIVASVSANETKLPKISFSNIQGSQPQACEGTFTHSFTVDEGAYLTEIKFGDFNNDGRVTMLGTPKVTVENSGRSYELNSQNSGLEFQPNDTSNPKPAPGGGTPTVYTPAGEIIDNPDRIGWQDSLNFPFDPSTFSGYFNQNGSQNNSQGQNNWIPAGSRVIVERKARFNNCADFKQLSIATDFDPNRQAVFYEEFKRPVARAEDSASDAFKLSGAPKENFQLCETGEMIGIGDPSKSGGGYIGKLETPKNVLGLDWIPLTNVSKGAFVDAWNTLFKNKEVQLLLDGGGIGEVAIDPKNPTKVVISAKGTHALRPQGWTLYSVDLTKAKLTNITQESLTELGGMGISNSPGQQIEGHAPFAYDGDGRLFSTSSSGSYPDQTALHIWDPNGTDNNFLRIAYGITDENGNALNGLTPGARGAMGIYDFAFDVSGNLLFVHSDRNLPRSKYEVRVIKKADLDNAINNARGGNITAIKSYPAFFNGKSSATFPVPQSAKNDQRNQYVSGIAWGQDGNLYFKWEKTNGASQVWSRYRINPNGTIGGVDSFPTTEVKDSPNRIIDISSCNLGVTNPKGKEENDKGTYVYKSAVDPVTGAVAGPGEATENKVTIDTDGKATVNYNIIYVNNSDSKKTVNPTDKFNVPSQIKGNVEATAEVNENGSWRKAGSTNSIGEFSFSLGQRDLPANSVVSIPVRITISTDSVNAWSATSEANECKATDGGLQKGFGFYNEVAPGTEVTNPGREARACVPIEVPPMRKVILKKEVYKAPKAGMPVSDTVALNNRITDPKAVNSFGLGFVSVDYSSAFNGFGGLSGVSSDVPLGNYAVAESVLGSQLFDSHLQFGEWSCNGDGVTTTNVVGGARVSIGEGTGDVVCSVQNTVAPVFEVSKHAKDPAEANTNGKDNSHIGKAVSANEKGEVTVEYTVKVHNPSALDGDTGKVSDTFVVPAGLVANGPAKVSYEGPGKPVGMAVGPNGSIASSTADGNTVYDLGLAKSVQGLNPGETGTFSISIPLKLDPNSETGYAAHKEELETCQAVENAYGKYAQEGGGAFNQVNLVDESYLYSPRPVLDNKACIPVKADPKFDISKLAAKDNGFEKTGSTVKVEKGKNTAELQWQVTVNNKSAFAAAPKDIADTMALPDGFKVTSMKLSDGNKDISIATEKLGTNQASFKVTEDLPVMEPGASVQWTLKTTVEVPSNKSKDAWEQAAECVEQDGGFDKSHGIVNTVSIAGEDAEQKNNNEACVPITPPDVDVPGPVIFKTDGNGTHPLGGARFSVKDVTAATESAPAPEVKVTEKDKAYQSVSGTQLYSSFQVDKLTVGHVYELREERAPQSKDGKEEYVILPEPVRFKVLDENTFVPVGYGKQDPAQCTGSLTDPAAGCSVLGNTFVFAADQIQVRDPRLGELPKAGGMGHWTPAAVGTLIIMVSMTVFFRLNGNDRRRNA